MRDSKCYLIVSQFLEEHIQIIADEFACKKDISKVTFWLKNIKECFYGKMNVPYIIYDLFVFPQTSFLLSVYRYHILDNTDELNFLIDVTTSFCQKRHLLSNSNMMIDSEMNQFFNWMAHFVDSQSFPRPFDEIHLPEIYKIRKIFLFDLKSLIHVDWIPGYEMFRNIYNFLQSASASFTWTNLIWWSEFEGELVSCLYEVSSKYDFFLPRLMVPIDGEMDNVDVIEHEFDIICDLSAFSHHLGHIKLGIQWLTSICLNIADKNVLDTDVNESAVLSLVETSLFKYLDAAQVAFDPQVRNLIANMLSIYIKAFSANRRGSKNSSELLKRFLQRFVFKFLS